MNGMIKNILKIAIPVLVVLTLAFITYSLLTKTHEDATIKIQPVQQPNTVLVGSKDKNTTTFQYQPKESPTDTDVAFTRNEEPLIVTVNGERHEISRDKVTETSKLENGKLVVNEVRQASIELKIPEQPRFKKGVFVETDTADRNIMAGLRLSYQTEPLDLDLKADLYNKKKDNRITVTATKWF